MIKILYSHSIVFLMKIPTAFVVSFWQWFWGSKLTQLAPQWKEFIITSIEIQKCYLSFMCSTILKKEKSSVRKVRLAACWFVIWTDKLNSSVQTCSAGHCMIFWPRCRFMTFYPSLDNNLLYFLKDFYLSDIQDTVFNHIQYFCSSLGCVPLQTQ